MKVQNPIIGRSRGSAGGMTFCKNYDKNVARARAFEVSNPKTALQTNQRTFFKEVMDITKTVSDEELRSLFGIKPKAMSRRNALSKQIAAAYSVVDGQKVVDFSKLQAIGNGAKVTTPIVYTEDVTQENIIAIDASMFSVLDPSSASIVVVIFDIENQKILLEKISLFVSEVESMYEILSQIDWDGVGYLYATCSTDGSNVFEKSFGSFTLKTRASKQSNAEPQPPTSIDVYANGTTDGSYFHFNENAYLKSQGYEPEDMDNDGVTKAPTITFDSESNWYGGILDGNLDTTKPVIINFVKYGESNIQVEANWIVQ